MSLMSMVLLASAVIGLLNGEVIRRHEARVRNNEQPTKFRYNAFALPAIAFLLYLITLPLHR